jgi:hypothetical protein
VIPFSSGWVVWDPFEAFKLFPELLDAFDLLDFEEAYLLCYYYYSDYWECWVF